MTHKQAIQRNFARRGATYDSHARIQQWMAAELLRGCKEAVLQARTILEVGCGIGTMLERLLDRGLLTRSAYTGIDVEAECIRAAAQRLQGYAARRQSSLTIDSDGTMLFATQTQDVRITFEAADLFVFLEHAPGKSAWDLLVAHAVLDLVDLDTALIDQALGLRAAFHQSGSLE